MSAASFNELTIYLLISSVRGLKASLNPDLIEDLAASTEAIAVALRAPTSDSTLALASIFYLEVFAYFDKTWVTVSTIPPGASSYLATTFLIADSVFFYCFSTASSASSFASSSACFCSRRFCFIISLVSSSSTTLSAISPSSYFLSRLLIIFLTSFNASFSSAFSYDF